MNSKIILSYFSLFCLGLYFATTCAASSTEEKWNRLEGNMSVLLTNVESYQKNLGEAKKELEYSKQQLRLANEESIMLKGSLELSKQECEQMQKSLENANNLLATYEKSMKAKISKQRRQKYLYVALSIGAIIYAKSK